MAHVNQCIKLESILRLVPFFVAVTVYFGFVRDAGYGELWTTLLKCIPIVCLSFYVLISGFTFTKRHKYSQRILLGLIFSCAGDALLNTNFFPHGMAAFAVAQICYIAAFGWQPLRLSIGIPIYLAGVVAVAVLYQRLDEVLRIGLPVYAALLLTMCWRSISRATHTGDWLSVLCALGSIFFVISDSLIGVDMFMVGLPYARIWIMSTYYFAQFSIVLSCSRVSDALQEDPTERATNSLGSQNKNEANFPLRQRAKFKK